MLLYIPSSKFSFVYLGVEYIFFNRVNPVANTMMKKILNRIAAEENVKLDTFALEALLEKSHGDIRLAINALQFECIKTDGFQDAFDISSDSESEQDFAPTSVDIKEYFYHSLLLYLFY
jgi:hypothetical protein